MKTEYEWSDLSRYLLQSYYETAVKNAHLVEKTALLLRISTLHRLSNGLVKAEVNQWMFSGGRSAMA